MKSVVIGASKKWLKKPALLKFRAGRQRLLSQGWTPIRGIEAPQGSRPTERARTLVI